MNILYFTQYEHSLDRKITSDRVKVSSDINTYGSDKQKSSILLWSDTMSGAFLFTADNLTNESDKCP